MRSSSANERSQCPVDCLCRSRGLTLIEFLVVVTILAVLAALLLPALSRAKTAGRNAVCKSNLHQIGLALRVYVDDYQVYPGFLATAPKLAGGILWQQALRLSDFSPAVTCPEHETLGFVFALSDDRGQRPVILSSGGYGYNAYGCAPNTQLCVGLAGSYWDQTRLWSPIPEAAVRSPANLIALGDTPPLGLVIAPVANANSPATVPSQRHSQGANMVFCDGHVEYKKQTRWIEPSNGARRQWNIDDEPHPEGWR